LCSISCPDAAFKKMRREARRKRMKLHDLAAVLIATVTGPLA
jgi:AmiR/NasT family two-component response regulator